MKRANLQMQIHRLSYVPWLLAASLVLGWAGEAPAQNLSGSFDRSFVYEGGGAQDITVTLKTEGDVAAKADIQVHMYLDPDSQTAKYRGDFFTVSTPTLLLKKGEKEVTGTLTITPVDNDRIGITPAETATLTKSLNLTKMVFAMSARTTNFTTADSLHLSPNIPILFGFSTGTGSKVSFATKNVIKWPDADATDGFVYFPFIELIDDDHWPGAIDLSFDPSKLNKQADATSIEVTGALDGGSLRDTTLSTQLAVTGGSLNRDTHYTLSDLGKLTIAKGKRSGTTRFTLDPNDTTNGTLTIGSSSNMTVVVKKRTHTYNDSIVEVRLDINYDGTFEKDGWAPDFGTQVIAYVYEGKQTARSGVPLLTSWGVDLNGDGDVGSELSESINIGGVWTSRWLTKSDIIPAGTVLVEKTLGIDFFEDGDFLDIYVVPPNRELTEMGLYEQDIGYGSGAGDYVSSSNYGKGSDDKFFRRGRIDFNGNGNFNDRFDLNATLKYINSFAFPVKVNTGTITIEADPTAKGKSFTLSPETIRENAGATDVQMTVEFDKAITKATTVTFKLTPTAGSGTRDVDYVADVVGGTVTIPAGDTKGTGMLRVTPVDNDKVGSTLKQWTFEVEALSGTTSLGKKTFTITDDEALSENIVLSASPSEIKEDAGATTVTISGALDGKPLAADATITLVRDSTPDKSATRDIDYTAVLSVLTIPQGELTGSTTITITPINDGVAADDKDKDETITLKQLTDNIENQDDAKVVVESVAITLKEVASSDTTTTTPTPTTTPGTAAAMGPSFGADADSLAFAATVGQAFSAVLPEAMGDGTLMYSVSTALPAGLSFAPATRTISGTPTMAGLATVVYTAIDSAGHGGARTFTITVSEARPVTVGVASVMASQSAVREDGETAEIQVTATLSGAATEDQRVRFTIVPPSSGTLASRDVDYTATLLGTVTIAAGGKTGSTTLFLSPIDNAAADGHKYLGIRASASGGWAQVDLRISDDETASTALVVSVMPSQVSESADLTEVQIMAALDGKPLAEAATVALSIDRASTATRDIDYLALFDPTITIAAGSIAGSTRLLLDPVADGMTEGDETIRIKAMLPGMVEGSATLVLTETAGEMMMPLAFVEGASIAAQSYTAGTAIHALELPAAVGGEGAITYSVSDLPAGLSFDAATRMISGTPDAATDGAVAVTYTAMAGDESASLMFTITVNPMLDFGDLSALFGGAGKRVPLQAGLNEAARLYLDAPTALPSVGEEFVLNVRLADFVAVRGYGLQVAYDADKLAFVRALPQDRAWAAPQVLDEAGVLTVVAHGETVADGELGLRLVFRPTTEIERTTLEITDTQTYDRALGFNRLALPAPVALQTRPAVFSLADNYPNPFNPTTTLQYALPQAADVALTVYNVLGQPVRTLVAERQNAGRYTVEWDATNDQGHRLSSGLYFYRLQAGGDFLEVKKMLLLK